MRIFNFFPICCTYLIFLYLFLRFLLVFLFMIILTIITIIRFHACGDIVIGSISTSYNSDKSAVVSSPATLVNEWPQQKPHIMKQCIPYLLHPQFELHPFLLYSYNLNKCYCTADVVGRRDDNLTGLLRLAHFAKFQYLQLTSEVSVFGTPYMLLNCLPQLMEISSGKFFV